MKVTKTNAVKTVLTISIGFSIIYILINAKWALYTSVSVGVLGLLSNRIAQGIDFLWMKLAKVLSYIVPNILLSIIFYLFLFPIAILSKIFNSKNALHLKNTSDTIWVDKENVMTKDSLEKMW